MITSRTLLKVLFLSWFAMSFLYSHLIAGIIDKREFYPFYTWSLYSDPSSVVQDYVIQIESWQGKILDKPCLIQDCSFLQVKSVKDTGIQGIVREFARGYVRKSGKFVRRKEHLEEFLLKNQNCQYGLYKRTYKPLSILRGTEAHPELTLVSSFQVGEL